MVILMGSLSMVGIPALAQTPDGETPANEGVCDELVGKTPGLYGLCVAFCEAQDADATFDPATGVVTFSDDSRPSNPKLLDVYNRKMNDGDPTMPCVNVVEDEYVCPCWTEGEINSLASVQSDFCGYTTTPSGSQLTILTGSGAYGPERASAGIAGSGGFGGGGYSTCSIRYYDSDSNTNIIRGQILSFAPPDESLLQCQASIEAQCDKRGF